MANEITLISSSKCFDGLQNVYSHNSEQLKCKMNFAVYIPPKSLNGEPVATMYWLTGLSSTEQSFIEKSGFQRYASHYGLLVVCPDTYPRGCVIEGENNDSDFGNGVGFYVDATQPKWKQNYRMYSYVVEELPAIIEQNLNIMPGRQSISGHSMGGHGALICALRNPGKYKVVSALSPLSNPSVSKFGIKILTCYLGEQREQWQQWDATRLVSKYNGPPPHLLIDQGSLDPHLDEMLPKNFVDECVKYDIPIVFREQKGYDHGYYFLSTFIEDHIRHHANILY